MHVQINLQDMSVKHQFTFLNMLNIHICENKNNLLAIEYSFRDLCGWQKSNNCNACEVIEPRSLGQSILITQHKPRSLS